MAELATLQARLEALQQCLGNGKRSVQIEGVNVSYRSVRELREAIAEIRRDIALAEGRQPVRTVRFTTSKGL